MGTNYSMTGQECGRGLGQTFSIVKGLKTELLGIIKQFGFAETLMLSICHQLGDLHWYKCLYNNTWTQGGVKFLGS